MYKIDIRARAQTDLDDIWLYSAQEWGAMQADRYVDALGDAIRRLAEQPKLGKSYAEIQDGALGLRIGRHIIFYVIEAEQISIRRVLHEQMEPLRHLLQ